MSSKEFSEWCAYSQLEPFGSDVLYLVGGIISSTIVNLFIKKGQKKATPSDYIPNFYSEPEESDQEDLLEGWNKLKEWARLANTSKKEKPNERNITKTNGSPRN